MERDTQYIVCLYFELYFNSHAHVERDNLDADDSIERIDFNSHAHVERDATMLMIIMWNFYFNSHAHVERDFSASGKLICIR